MKHVLRFILFSIIILTLCIPLRSMAESSRNIIRIGIPPEMNIFKQKQRFKLLGEYLSKKTGMNVEFTIQSSYGNLVNLLASEKIDGAFFGSFAGAMAIKKLGVVPLVRPVNLDGSSVYHSCLFVRRDGGIKNVHEMKNKKMAYVDKLTTAGYLFPLAYLKEKGVADTSHFFGETFFTGSHDAAVNAVLNRKADVGAAKYDIYDRMRKQDPRVERELVIIAESSNVPSNGLLVSSTLQASTRGRLKTVLLGMNSDPDGKSALQQLDAIQFIETTPKDYQPVLDMAKKSGIDVMTYKFSNH